MRITRWKHNMSRFGELSGADRWLLVRAGAWLGIARIRLALTPFRRLAAQLSSEIGMTEPDEELLNRVGYAVAAAASHLPWRSDCFPQTIAARSLLKSYGYGSTIHLGVERGGDDNLLGHAWLTCGGTVVTGGAERERYTEIHDFRA